MRFFLIVLVVVAALSNEYHDEDLDGVIDSLDRCPHTPFNDIVDEYGCSVERLMRPKRLEQSFEYLYIKDKQSRFKERDFVYNLSLYKDRFSLSFSIPYFFNASKEGLSDVSIEAEYRLTPTPMWDLYLDAGVQLPTFNVNGNRLDWGIGVRSDYFLSDYKLFSGLYYSLTQDRFRRKKAKNYYGVYGGAEYYWKGCLIDLAYIYNKGKFGRVSHFGYMKAEYLLNTHTFIYSYASFGLNKKAIDHIYAFGIGRRF